MKTFTKLALGIALLFGITSCASATATGKIKTGEIPVSKDYTDLTVSSAINIVWSETATSATLKADEAVFTFVIESPLLVTISFAANGTGQGAGILIVHGYTTYSHLRFEFIAGDKSSQGDKEREE